MRISDWSSDVCSSDLTNGEQGRDEVKTIRKMMLGAAASALLLTSVTAPAALAQSSANQTALVDYVNPLMGTDSSYRLSYGNTYPAVARSEEHTSELQSLMRTSYAVFCLKKKTNNTKQT